MDYLIKSYLTACEAASALYGFKRRRWAFARVVNDVFQNITVERIAQGHQFRVCFSVIPLCFRIDKRQIEHGVYPRYLKKFQPGSIPHDALDSWPYDKNSTESIDACIKDVMGYMNDYLYPYFERADSCKNALPEAIKLDILFEENRLESLRRANMKDLARHEEWTRYLNSTWYYMALKNGDYDFAEKHLKARCKQNRSAYDSWIKNNMMTEEKRFWFDNRLMQLEAELERFQAKDTVYFQKIIDENEAFSRGNLKNFIVR